MSTLDRRLSTVSVASTSSMSGDYTSHSVQELFEKYSIHEIQKLNRNYEQQVSQSTDALQALVSSKYRDLIAITDEISETYQMTNALETQLSDLAYRRGKFVSFNTPNRFSDLAASMLTTEMERIRTQERFQILNQVVYDKLLHFDLAIAGNTTPLLHTSNYIYYSKLYYILESAFADDLEQNRRFRSRVAKMKEKYNGLLESYLSSFNLSCTSLYNSDSDKFYRAQHLVVGNLLLKAQTTVLEDADIDLEEILEDSVTLHPDHEYEDVLPEQYNQNTLSIVNYLAAYAILNGHNAAAYTNGSLLLRLLDLRYQFLERILNQTLERLDSTTVTHLNFFSIFRFIENTMGYASTYFAAENPHSAFVEQLENVTSVWDPNKLLGIDDWISETIQFDVNRFTIDLPQSTLDEMSHYHLKFITLVSSFYSKVVNVVDMGDSIDAVSNHFLVLSNLITGLKRLSSFCASNETQSQLVHLLSTGIENPLTEGLGKTIKKISQIHQHHLDQLDDDEGILSHITASLQDHSYANEKLCLFSSDLVDIIDEDLTTYFNMIQQASVDKCFSFESRSVFRIICTWFESSSKFSKHLSLEPVEASERSDAFLVRISEYLARTDTRWGTFSRSLLSERFEEVKDRTSNHLWERLSQFLDKIGDLLKEEVKNKDTQNVYYLASIIHVLKDQVKGTDSNDSSLIEKLNTLSQQTYDYMIDTIPSTKADSVTFYDQFEATLDHILKEANSTDDLLSLISLRLESLMFHLAALFLQPLSGNYESDYKSGLLFTSNDGGKAFAEVKNKWIQKELIDKRVFSRLSENKVDKKTLLAVISGTTFLQCLIGPDEKADYTVFVKYCEEPIEEEDITRVTKSVTEAYKMSSSTYFPLNA